MTARHEPRNSSACHVQIYYTYCTYHASLRYNNVNNIRYSIYIFSWTLKIINLKLPKLPK